MKDFLQSLSPIRRFLAGIRCPEQRPLSGISPDSGDALPSLFSNTSRGLSALLFRNRSFGSDLGTGKQCCKIALFMMTVPYAQLWVSTGTGLLAISGAVVAWRSFLRNGAMEASGVPRS
jgi:hypothetical protein